MNNKEMINPRVDLAFKKLFGVEENKDILLSLLNSIVSEEDQIESVELLNPYNERNFKKDKLSVLDIKARNKHDGTYFLVEMQLADEVDYPKRGLYSWARVYSNQLASGMHYDRLSRTIAIHILNFTFIDYDKARGWIKSAPSKYHHRFVLSDKETRVEMFDDIEIHTIELSKFEAIDARDLDHVLPKVKTVLDKWVAVLTKYELLDGKKLPAVINLPEIKKALGVIQEMSLNKVEREIYNSHLDFLRIEYSAFLKQFMEGKEEGIAEGMEKGKAEGRAEGKLEVARKMLSEGLDMELVAKVTNLSDDELKKLGKL